MPWSSNPHISMELLAPTSLLLCTNLQEKKPKLLKMRDSRVEVEKIQYVPEYPLMSGNKEVLKERWGHVKKGLAEKAPTDQV